MYYCTVRALSGPSHMVLTSSLLSLALASTCCCFFSLSKTRTAVSRLLARRGCQRFVAKKIQQRRGKIWGGRQNLRFLYPSQPLLESSNCEKGGGGTGGFVKSQYHAWLDLGGERPVKLPPRGGLLRLSHCRQQSCIRSGGGHEIVIVGYGTKLDVVRTVRGQLSY